MNAIGIVLSIFDSCNKAISIQIQTDCTALIEAAAPKVEEGLFHFQNYSFPHFACYTTKGYTPHSITQSAIAKCECIRASRRANHLSTDKAQIVPFIYALSFISILAFISIFVSTHFVLYLYLIVYIIGLTNWLTVYTQLLKAADLENGNDPGPRIRDKGNRSVFSTEWLKSLLRKLSAGGAT